MTEEEVDPTVLSFGDVDLSATVFDGVIGEAFSQQLPEASGGEAPYLYSVANLPAGLSFSAETRTISGTPTAVGETTIVYTVIDDKVSSAAMTTKIEVTAAPPPAVAVASVTASQISVRESAEATEIGLVATLAEAAPVAGSVSFTLGVPSEGVGPSATWITRRRWLAPLPLRRARLRRHDAYPHSHRQR